MILLAQRLGLRRGGNPPTHFEVAEITDEEMFYSMLSEEERNQWDTVRDEKSWFSGSIYRPNPPIHNVDRHMLRVESLYLNGYFSKLGLEMVGLGRREGLNNCYHAVPLPRSSVAQSLSRVQPWKAAVAFLGIMRYDPGHFSRRAG